MSNITPCQYSGSPCSSRTRTASSRNQTLAIVGREHPVLGRERLARQVGVAVLFFHRLAVVGVDGPSQWLGVGQPLRGGDAQDLLDARVDVREGGGSPTTDSEYTIDGQLLDQRAVAGLGLASERLALASGG